MYAGGEVELFFYYYYILELRSYTCAGDEMHAAKGKQRRKKELLLDPPCSRGSLYRDIVSHLPKKPRRCLKW